MLQVVVLVFYRFVLKIETPASGSDCYLNTLRLLFVTLKISYVREYSVTINSTLTATTTTTTTYLVGSWLIIMLIIQIMCNRMS